MKILKQQQTLTIKLRDPERQLLDWLIHVLFRGDPYASESRIFIYGLLALSETIQKDGISHEQTNELVSLVKNIQTLPE